MCFFVDTTLERCWFNSMVILEAVCGELVLNYTERCLYYFGVVG